MKSKKFMVKISFIDKPAESKIVENTDNITALTFVLNSISLGEKDNVIGVELTYIGE